MDDDDEPRERPIDRLHKAIIQYYRETEPETYVNDWVLCADTDAPRTRNESEFSVRKTEYRPFVGITTAPDMRWTAAVGTLRIAAKYKERPR